MGPCRVKSCRLAWVILPGQKPPSWTGVPARTIAGWPAKVGSPACPKAVQPTDQGSPAMPEPCSPAGGALPSHNLVGRSEGPSPARSCTASQGGPAMPEPYRPACGALPGQKPAGRPALVALPFQKPPGRPEGPCQGKSQPAGGALPGLIFLALCLKSFSDSEARSFSLRVLPWDSVDSALGKISEP